MSKFHIVYFVCMTKLWKEKTILSFNNILKSRILDDNNLNKLHVVSTGEVNDFQELKNIWIHPKIEFTLFSNDLKVHEYPGIEKVKKISLENPNDNILYFHSKGITRGNAASDWVEYMEYFNIIKYKNCLEYLNKDIDIVGVEYLDRPKPHMSGNFWWAKCNYINKLTLPKPYSKRHEFEWFIGSFKSFKAFSFHQSKIDTPRFPGFNASSRSKYLVQFYKNKNFKGYIYKK